MEAKIAAVQVQIEEVRAKKEEVCSQLKYDASGIVIALAVIMFC